MVSYYEKRVIIFSRKEKKREKKNNDFEVKSLYLTLPYFILSYLTLSCFFPIWTYTPTKVFPLIPFG